ncbi:response regulator transcription factor [Ideonella sp. 4Y11]|uniref:Response regulator transcription factor n=1 Tax=Ideonella aquatica TaxID=2824119 RepID=A0A941BP32_9BURK|nr:response regulator transcription factor [Ideonella aquatica]MBQ0957630.1 response regulator transcription factor [Ideonella aquatica]
MSPPSESPTDLLDAGDADVVLVVDDVPDNLAVLHDALDESGYTVLVATHGEAALERARQARPHLVLLDAVMPGMDGFEVARRLKADPATAAIPIVFMTGLTDAEHVVQAFAAGGIDYVTKPLRPREVLARIAAHLRAARAQAQARNALDAFGHATLVLRQRDGRRLWQTALARQLLREHFPEVPDEQLPAPLLTWVQEVVPEAATSAPTRQLQTPRGRLTLALHPMGEDDGTPGTDGEWLLVLREASEAALMLALAQAFPQLTAREREVLYWVVQGKTNRDIGDILGTSPRTVHKHLEHVFEKLGVETRTAAAGVVMARMGR